MTAPPLRARAERFGAWVRLDDQTLVALDRASSARLGVAGGSLWSAPLDPRVPSSTCAPVAPLELHVAITTRCPASCVGCYLDAGPSGSHVAIDDLERTLAAASAAGVFTVAFGGGEPLTHPAIGELADRARAHGLTPVVTTSGIGMTAERARELRSFAQVNVSHDGVGEAYEAVRGFDGAHVAERAIALLIEAGVAVGINVVLTRASFGAHGEGLEATCARGAALGAREAQLLRYKPAGRAASLEYLARRLSREQVLALPQAIGRIVGRGAPSIRVDCALVPFLGAQTDGARDEPSSFGVEELAALGVMGCEAARGLAAVKADGRVAPCSFLEASDARPDALRSLDDARGRDATLSAHRSYADAPPAPCDTCAIHAVCRGGCRVVAAHVGGSPFAPDPECPRVIAAREGA